jgi:hypothetical protein
MSGFDLFDEAGRGRLAAEFSTFSPDLRRSTHADPSRPSCGAIRFRPRFTQTGDSPAGDEEGQTMTKDTTQDVLIEQDETRMAVVATLTPDTETGDPDGWAILYRVPEGRHAHLDDARPYSVVSATGRRAHFMAWRKVGRQRLGIGIGAPPMESAE